MCAVARDDKTNDLDINLKAAREGDARALDRLLGGLWPWLRKKARSFRRRAVPAIGESSLMQETALRFSTSIRRMRAADSPAVKALLSRIMKNTAISAHRAAASQQRDASRALLEELMPWSPDASDDQLCHSEQVKRLYAAIEQLPDRQREVILLQLSGTSAEEIARRWNVSQGSVHMLNLRAKERLTRLLR